MKLFFKLFSSRLEKLEKRNKKKGFTLLETLVAIAIFTLSILGLMSILSQGVSDSSYAKKKIIAGYLAQEGIEYIRNMRDTFVLYDGTSAQVGWDSFNEKLLNSLCQENAGCYFDNEELDYENDLQPITDTALVSCGENCLELLYYENTGRYNYISGEGSGFIRKIQINQVSADEVKIFSTVFWDQGSGSYNVVFSESVFNWME